MLGGGAKVSVGFLKELQSVIHCHLYDDHTHTHIKKRQSAVGWQALLAQTELYSG